MSTEITTAPTSEPVTIDEVKDHMRVTQSGDDHLIEEMIAEVRQYVERYLKRALVTQTITLRLDAFPANCGQIYLPRAPASALASINYLDSAGDSTLLDASAYVTDFSHQPARIQPAYGLSWPATRGIFNSVTIVFTAGYGAATDVPAPLKLAIKKLIHLQYDNREDTSFGGVLNEMPFGVTKILDNYRLTSSHD